ncbi:hypothetical protein [uncultured Sphaerochaeta sp.]|uniref:hypothetical protein n=1 Tax=uncultured Sphaerochaeta sp. TaxID=886478 RepID=UPI002633ED5F|nr:hypothetical protein [uncultured Sphaerochaeta sp.]
MAENLGGNANILKFGDYSPSYPAVAKGGGGSSGPGSFDDRLGAIMGDAPSDMQAVSSDFDEQFMKSWLGLFNYAKGLKRKGIDVTQGVDPRGGPKVAEAVSKFYDALAMHMSNRERLKRGRELQDKFYQGMLSGQIREGTQMPDGIITDQSYMDAMIQALPKAIDEYTATLARYKPETASEYDQAMAHYNEIVDSIKEVGAANGLDPAVTNERIAMLPVPINPGMTPGDELDLKIKEEQAKNLQAQRANIYDQIKKRGYDDDKGKGGKAATKSEVMPRIRMLASLLNDMRNANDPVARAHALDFFGGLEWGNAKFKSLDWDGNGTYRLSFDEPISKEDGGDGTGIGSERVLTFSDKNISPALMLMYGSDKRDKIAEMIRDEGLMTELDEIPLDGILNYARAGALKSPTPGASGTAPAINFGFGRAYSAGTGRINLGFQ